MTKQVIKSSGEKVAFNEKKIHRSITRAAQDAKLPPAEINKLVNEVSSIVMQTLEPKDKVMSIEIRNLILAELDLVAPNVASEWRRFMDASRKK